MYSIVKLFILMMLASSVHPDPSNDVDNCLASNKRFTESERKYIDKRVPTEEVPDLPGPQIEEFQKKVYAKEKHQRLFECISNKTYELSTDLLELNPKYQAVALACRKKQHQPSCKQNYKYRTFDGTCNNVMHPKWGSLLSCLQRFLPQSYEGVSGFRQSVCGGPLPEPREVSLKIFTDYNRPNRDITHMLVFLGQFVAHDLSDVPITFVGTERIDCCSHPGENQHPQCAPILISSNDSFYSKFNVTCINFLRAALCETCDIGKRNQMNQATSYIDLSHVYGLNDKLAKNLRSEDGKGKLKSQYKNGEELLPPDHSLDMFGACGPHQEACFLAGDRRVNMHTSLMTLQTLFQREHNRIAEKLNKYNPSWDDEKLYQEARKINIAQMQVITYKEFLPLLIGPEHMALYGLDIMTGKSIYNTSVDATIWAEFNGAAYRLHTLINGIVAKHGCRANKILLRNTFGDAELLYKGSMSSLMKGICQSPAQQYDRYVTREMTDYLYKTPQGSWGFDMAAVSIQRGRDMGLPTYTEMVKYMTGGLLDIQTFEHLNVSMDESNINVLKEIYCDVRDIDLWVGLTNEKAEKNMLIGPTSRNIIARQFSNLKNGDRFFFQHDGNFNDQQLTALKEASLSRIMCDNTKIHSIQQNVLKLQSPSNPIKNCKDIPKVNLWFWS